MALPTSFFNNNTVQRIFEKEYNLHGFESSLYMKGNEYVSVYEDGKERCFYPIELRWKDSNGITKICIIKPKLMIKHVKAFPFDYITHVYDYNEMEKDFFKIFMNDNKRNNNERF